MRKICILILIAAMLLLSACEPILQESLAGTESMESAGTISVQNSVSPTETASPEKEPWYAKIKWNGTFGWTGHVVEQPKAFYYIAEDGLYRYDKESQNKKRIVQGEIWGLFRYEEQLYFHTEQQIFRLTDEKGTSELVWDYRHSARPKGYYLDAGAINDFQIYNGDLYIKLSGISAIRYNLKSKQAETFCDDFSSLVFYDHFCYYTPHAERSFSIYQMDMDTKESVLVRGDGKTKDNGTYNAVYYDGLAAHNGELYYFTRFTGDVFEYNHEAKDELCLDVSALETDIHFLSCPYYQNLCYFTCDDEYYRLYEYDANGNHTLLLTVEKSLCDYRSIVVTESAVFWSAGEDSPVNCVMKQRADRS